MIAAVAVVVAAALLLQAVGPRALPETVPVPALAGHTLLVYHRRSNPESAPRAITFEPANYDVFEPAGERIGVALRCVGRGDVRISAGRYFFFHCGDRPTTFVQRSTRRFTQPFLILGRTTGNAVWSVRIVLIPATRSE